MKHGASYDPETKRQSAEWKKKFTTSKKSSIKNQDNAHHIL